MPASTSCTLTVKVTSNTPGIYTDASGIVTTPIALNTSAPAATLTVLTAQCVLDLDGDGVIDPLTDGLILIRAMSGLTGPSATAGGVGSSPGRSTWNAISPYINPAFLDIDGDTFVDSKTDGLMLLRMMFKLSGDVVTANAVGANATRTNWTAIRDYVNTQCGTNFN